MKNETDEKEKIQAEQKDVSEKEEEKQSSTSSKNTCLPWVILSLGSLIVLTIAVFAGMKLQKSYGSKLFGSLLPQKEEEVKVTETPTAKVKTKEDFLIDVFRYPGSTEIPVSDDMYCVQLLLYTNDPVITVYQYYEDLIDLNGWETGPVGMETGDKAGFFYIYQDDFGADINMKEEASEHGSTKIEVNITCKNGDAVTSTYIVPSRIPSVGPTILPASPASEPINQHEYVLPFSATRAVARQDLTGLTPWELKVARNEIYARHGRPFVHQDLTCYFEKQQWYGIDPEYTEDSLSTLETSNAVFILNFEKEINSPLLNKDTGCR